MTKFCEQKEVLPYNNKRRRRMFTTKEEQLFVLTQEKQTLEKKYIFAELPACGCMFCRKLVPAVNSTNVNRW